MASRPAAAIHRHTGLTLSRPPGINLHARYSRWFVGPSPALEKVLLLPREALPSTLQTTWGRPEFSYAVPLISDPSSAARGAVLLVDP